MTTAQTTAMEQDTEMQSKMVGVELMEESESKQANGRRKQAFKKVLMAVGVTVSTDGMRLAGQLRYCIHSV